MIIQAILPQKNHFTLGAQMLFLSGMDFTMFVQGARLGKGLATWGADEGLTSYVCPLVTLKVTRFRESLVTLRAGIWFFAGVYSHVSSQAVWPWKGLCALWAGVRSHCELFSVSSSYWTGRKTYHMRCRGRAVLLCGLVGEFLGFQPEQTFFHKHRSQNASLLNEWISEILVYLD